MIEHPIDGHPALAYQNEAFLNRPEARTLRMLAEYLEPQSRLRRENIQDTIVFFGSARIHSPDAAAAGGAGNAIAMAHYYEDARALAHKLTIWSLALPRTRRRFVVTSGGGPGIMEAANRGAREAGGLTMGFNIRLPFEQVPNPYISPELSFDFHYFFMRKFWFVYLAKAVVLFPGGFGTLDEFFEMLTLVQTRKMKKRMPIVLFGAKYWNEVLNFDALVKYGTISPGDVALFHRTDSVDEAYQIITRGLTENALGSPGAEL